jgi:predicted peroxiredoxin
MTGRIRYTLALLTLALLALASCRPAPAIVEEPPPKPPPRDGVFVHLSHGPEDPHRVVMALRMAELMSADRDVLVYFDIEGIRVVLKDAPDVSHGEFPSSRTELGKLLDAGVPLLACPGCLQAAGKTAEDLMDGVQVASKEPFFGFTEGRILTLDY